ncbi:HAD family hydrolase [Nakamurella silvestris]|nr:HAD family hydrolase [Nakamurella silvestris]
MQQWVVDAILFDLDGTLIDSTPSVERSWRSLGEKVGIPYEEYAGMYHGVPAKQTLRRLLPDISAAELDDLAEWLVEVEATDTEDIIVLPGTETVLDLLPVDRWAIATSGTERLAKARIEAAGLKLPRTLVTADDVTTGKPDPAPYLLAAERLGFHPSRCLVVEDAPAGVTSGLAAGCPVLGLRTTHDDLTVPTVADLSEADISADRNGIIVTIG